MPEAKSLSYPPPAEVLREIPPSIKRLPEGTRLWRVYRAAGRHSVRWSEFRSYGPLTSGRFDHHAPPPRKQPRRIFYGSWKISTCIAEVFQETRIIDPHDEGPCLVGFEIVADLDVLNVTDKRWCREARAPEDLHLGSRRRARRWSKAIYDAYPEVQGIYYPSSKHSVGENVALFERAAHALPGEPTVERLLDDPSFETPLANIAAELGYDLNW